MKNKRYCWVAGNTIDHIKEIIESGDAFCFQYSGKDYFIAYYDGAYQIQDPQIGEDGLPQLGTYIEHIGHNEAKTPDELLALPFLDGKTIFERFDELKFFD